MKSKSVIFVLLIVLSIIIGVAGGFFISKMICEQRISKLESELAEYKNNANNSVNTNQSVNTVENTANSANSKRFTVAPNYFTVDMTGLKAGDSVTEQVTSDMKVTIKQLNLDGEWSISVNGSAPAYTETTIGMNDKIKFMYTNKYIIYSTCVGTDIRSESLVVIDNNGKKVKEIYELDESNKGLVYYESELNGNTLTVKASRTGHGGSVIADKYYKANASDFNKEALEKIPADMVTAAMYIYKISADGSIDFDNPQIVNTQTFKEHLQSWKDNIYEADVKAAVSEFLEKNK